MRIALLHTPLDVPGGGERQALRLARELETLGHSVTLYTNSWSRERCYPELSDGLSIEVVGKGPLLGGVSRLLEFGQIPSADKLFLLSLARAPREGAELLNPHNIGPHWAAAGARNRLDIPAVWMCNEPPHAYHTPQAAHRFQALAERLYLASLDRTSAKAMDGIAVLDEKNARRVRDAYGRDARVVRTGVDAEFFAARARYDRRAEFGLEGRFVMLHVGYAAPWKGQRDCLVALRELSEKDDGFALVLAGANTKGTYEPLARELGVLDRVRFFEGFSDEFLAALYASCDVLLFPADQTWGLNVTEAWAAGKPAIVSEAAGVSEVVEDGVNGFVVPRGSPGEIAKWVRLLRADPALGRQMGGAGQQYVRNHLTWHHYAAGMVRLFEEALSGRLERRRA